MPLAAPVTNATFPPKLPFWFLAISYFFPICLVPRDRATRCVMVGARAKSLVVLLVADLFHPVNHFAVELFLDGDVRYRRGRRRVSSPAWPRCRPLRGRRRRPSRSAGCR